MVESVKTASDLFSPVSGEIVATNLLLSDEPELINDDPAPVSVAIRSRSFLGRRARRRGAVRVR